MSDDVTCVEGFMDEIENRYVEWCVDEMFDRNPVNVPHQDRIEHVAGALFMMNEHKSPVLLIFRQHPAPSDLSHILWTWSCILHAPVLMCCLPGVPYPRKQGN